MPNTVKEIAGFGSLVFLLVFSKKDSPNRIHRIAVKTNIIMLSFPVFPRGQIL